jgi:hypothetical protein
VVIYWEQEWEQWQYVLKNLKTGEEKSIKL